MFHVTSVFTSNVLSTMNHCIIHILLTSASGYIFLDYWDFQHSDLNLLNCLGEHVLDEVGEVCYLSLKTLKIVNITRTPFSMMAVGSFVNLRCLVISPHNLGDDLVENISHMPKLRNVQIVSNAYSECVPTPVDYRSLQNKTSFYILFYK